MSKVQQRIRRSARAFRDLVWPKVQHLLQGDLFAVEDHTGNELCNLLDVLAGIDYWRVEANTGIQGIASRVSFIKSGEDPWNTFTITYRRPNGRPAEFEKRVKAFIDQKYVTAAWMVQANIIDNNGDNPNQLLSLALIDMHSLIHFAIQEEPKLEKMDCKMELKSNTKDKSSFLVVPWNVLLQEKSANLTVCKYPYLLDA